MAEKELVAVSLFSEIWVQCIRFVCEVEMLGELNGICSLTLRIDMQSGTYHCVVSRLLYVCSTGLANNWVTHDCGNKWQVSH